ncbi:MAG: ABC transporter substrate-binding protein [Acidimicrobiia bacterium]|nr:ABC transporter substrate-binding protein [Acidimicrobiia bacterium]
MTCRTRTSWHRCGSWASTCCPSSPGEASTERRAPSQHTRGGEMKLRRSEWGERPHRRRAGVALSLVVVAAIVAACGGDDGESGSGTTSTVDQAVRSAVEGQLDEATASTEASQVPTSMEEWEALWAEERAAIVERISSDGGGTSADGTTATGPGGFTIDLSACPAGWGNTEGVSLTSFKLGFPSPQSGPVADAGNLPKAAEAILAAYAREHAFTDSEGVDRSAEIVVRDDMYDPSRTVALVDELIDSEKVFALTVIGQSNFLRTYEKLNQRCIPMPFNAEGHPASGDPVNHPWSSNFLLLGSTEALIWGTYIEEHLDEWGGKVKVASLVATNDTGMSYHRGFENFIAQSPRKADIEYVSEMIEPGTPTIKDPMTTLAAQQPDIFIYMGPASVTCTQAIIEVAEAGLKDELTAAFQPGNCKASSFIGAERVGGDGSAADGWMIVGGGWKDFNSEALDDDPWVAWAREQLAAAGYDYRSSASLGQGTATGWMLAQALQVAGALPGGLTRSNFALAARFFDMTHPGLVPGISVGMDGADDAYLLEGSDISRWEAAGQRWVIQSTVDLSGTTPPCAWDVAATACR